jgi:hypothetical protein
MVFLLFALTTGLFLVSAKEKNRWFRYQLRGRDGKMIVSATVPIDPGGDPYYDVDGGMPESDGTVWFHLRALGLNGELEKIGARTVWILRGASAGEAIAKMSRLPEREFLYAPGEKLTIPVDGYGNLGLDGQFQSKLPDTVRSGLYPQDDTFQILPPVALVRADRLLSKADFGGGHYSPNDSYFAYHSPKNGWYVFSAKPQEGAAEGTITRNQIEFNLENYNYVLLAAAPITFGTAKVWVKHYAAIEQADPLSGWQAQSVQEEYPELAFGELRNLTVEK